MRKKIKFNSEASIPEDLFEENKAEILTSACYLLIQQSHELNADTAKYKFEGVTNEGVGIGDWEISIKRTKG